MRVSGSDELKASGEVFELQRKIDYLLDAEYDTIDAVNASNVLVNDLKKKQLNMMKQELTAVHHHKISVTSGGFYQSVYDEKGNRFRCKTEEGLYSKLYEYYFGAISLRKMSSFAEVYEEFLRFRLQEDTVTELTAQQDGQTWNKYLRNSQLAGMCLLSTDAA